MHPIFRLASYLLVTPPAPALAQAYDGLEQDPQYSESGDDTRLAISAFRRFCFFPISNVVLDGRRLQMVMTSSIRQTYAAPPLAGGGPVTLTLHTGPDYASAVTLPMLKD